MAVDQPVDRRLVTGSAAGARILGMSASAALVVAGTLLFSVAVHYLLALDQKAPWLMGDELRYAEMAKSFLADGKLLFREEYTSFATAYPALIAPAWAAADISTAYELAKAINVVLMTCSAVVVFFWTRRLTPLPYALVSAGLVLLMPTFAYTGMLMMENAALPAFLLAIFTIALALERPTLARQLLVFAAIAVATLFRIQGVTLAVVYPTAILLLAVFEWRAGSGSILSALRRFRFSFGLLVLGALVYVAYKLLSGGSFTGGLGAYSTVGDVDYDVGEVARWSVWHAGELAFSVGFIPVVAFAVLATIAVRRGSLPTRAERAFVAVAAATTFWFVLQAAAFASRFSGRIEERYMVYAAPLLFVALAVWLARDQPRPAIATLLAALVAGLLVLTIPFERFFNVAIYADSFGLIPLLRLSDQLGGDVADVRLAVAIGIAVAGIALVALTARLGRVIFPAAVAAFLVLSAYTVYGAVEVQSAGARNASAAADPSWVDDTVGSSARVAFIFSRRMVANPHLLWQTEFWNRSVRGVYALETGSALTFAGPEIRMDTNGRLVPKLGRPPQPIDEPYVLADPKLGILGRVVSEHGPLALIRVKPPVRIPSAMEGIYDDGWTGPNAALSQYAPLSGGARRLHVTVSRLGWSGPDVPARVTITAGPLRLMKVGATLARPTARRSWTAHAAQSQTFTVPVPPAPFRLEIHVDPSFSPAQFGFGDSRRLGVQVTFAPASA